MSVGPLELADTEVSRMLRGLLDRDVNLEPAETDVQCHPQTLRGLLTDQNELVGVIGSDLPFAHSSGAALAMVPAPNVEDLEEGPDEDLLEFYVEVANVLSRVVNEASPERVRIDPGIDIHPSHLEHIMATGDATGFEVSIDSYGLGKLGFWIR